MFLHQRAVYRDSNGACCFLGVLKALSLLFLALSLALSLLLLLLWPSIITLGYLLPYRVTMVVTHLGWVDLNSGSSTLLLGSR